ncbi:hypothetical protein JJQ72_15690 [Paenibacillus sp. F411]|uniref:Uncharacterized protein n=1 Tax=Paenibacillus algicola TaxID=2565926 RepID=A0A4V1G3E2_9BACL|nr:MULTISPECIES: hypothetical protein [Paenibacillus]MBO2945419.1 hypothetical protein [Paenibacillus sp. F411]QCT00884.1 hypothetical protein E6C60_0158 [Paenibacillus algicola]
MLNDYLKKNKMTWIVLAPLLGGWLFQALMTRIPASGVLIWTIHLGFVVFWFWAGRQFSQMKKSTALSFVMGNSLWLICLLLFLWQFMLAGDESRSLVLALMAQLYVLLIVGFGTQLQLLLTGSIDAAQIIIMSYILMLLVFTAGFVYERVRKPKPENHTL